MGIEKRTRLILAGGKFSWWQRDLNWDCGIKKYRFKDD